MNCEPLSYLPQGERICYSPPWEGAGEVLFLFPLRGNFVTLKGCKKNAFKPNIISSLLEHY